MTEPAAPLRVAMFVDAFPVLSETFIVNQITGLLDRGHEVTVFALEQRPAEKIHPVVEQYGLVQRTRYIDQRGGGKLHLLRECVRLIFAHPPLLWRRLPTLLRALGGRTGNWGRLPLLRVAAADIDAGGFDVVHCQYGNLGVRVLPMVRNGILHGRLLTAIRGHDVTQTERFGAEFYKDLIREGDGFMPVSRSLQDILQSMGCPSEQIHIVRSAIDCRQFNFRPRMPCPDRPAELISVARLVEMKGIEYAIRAVAQLHQQGVPVRYQVIGYGPLFEALQTLVQQLGLQSHVQLHGAMAHDELVRQLDQADIFVAPSVTAANGEKEGIPNAVKEAMAQGMPVVATRHSGIPELVEDGVSGYLVEERDVEGLAGKIKLLLDQPRSWPDMGRAGRKHIEQEYDLPVVQERLLACYTAVLTG